MSWHFYYSSPQVTQFFLYHSSALCIDTWLGGIGTTPASYAKEFQKYLGRLVPKTLFEELCHQPHSSTEVQHTELDISFIATSLLRTIVALISVLSKNLPVVYYRSLDKSSPVFSLTIKFALLSKTTTPCSVITLVVMSFYLISHLPLYT